MAKMTQIEYSATLANAITAALTAGADGKTFTVSGLGAISRLDDYKPTIKPNGIVSGCGITVNTGTNNSVIVAAGSANVNGVVTAISQATVTITRDVTDDFQKVTIYIDNAGAVQSTVGTGAAVWSDTFGGNGGPPYTPTDGIMVGQLHLSSTSNADILDSEIKVVPNLHREQASYPTYSVGYLTGEIVFNVALVEAHTGDVVKAVHAELYSPSFITLETSRNVVTPANTLSLASEEFYEKSIGASSSTLNAGTIETALDQGIQTAVLDLEGQYAHVRFYPDADQTGEYYKFNGQVGIANTWNTAGVDLCSMTIVSGEAAIRVV